MIKKLSYIIIAGLLVVMTLISVYFYTVSVPLASSANSTSFIVAKGENIHLVGEKLQSAGIIRSSYFFRLYSYFHGLDNEIKAGEYQLNPSQTIAEIAGIIASGEAADDERTIKIIEGWRMDDMADYFTVNNIIGSEDFSRIKNEKIGDWDLVFSKPDFLNDAPKQATLEGFLFPDTYRIFKNATAEDIAKKMLDNFDAKLTLEMRADIKNQGKSIYEIITLASIIEREVRTFADMKIVSGIFWDRIKNGQALESCATLAYILNENKKQYTYEDTRIDSPYNTYINPGLPPGPICNPGINAIKAAIYPKKTDYYYFLNRLDTGETVFSRNYQEHLQNKAKYLP